jgi:hypothetical protein
MKTIICVAAVMSLMLVCFGVGYATIDPFKATPFMFGAAFCLIVVGLVEVVWINKS